MLTKEKKISLVRKRNVLLHEIVTRRIVWPFRRGDVEYGIYFVCKPVGLFVEPPEKLQGFSAQKQTV